MGFGKRYGLNPYPYILSRLFLCKRHIPGKFSPKVLRFPQYIPSPFRRGRVGVGVDKKDSSPFGNCLGFGICNLEFEINQPDEGGAE